MQSQLIDPFVKATINVISTMCSINPLPGEPFEKVGTKTWGDVTGIIGLAGASVMGNMMLSFDKLGALHVVNKMLLEDFVDINRDVIDAVGEMTNMITGGAKKDLLELGMQIEMAVPVVVSGKGVDFNQMGPTRIITIPFSLPRGAFVVEANLAQR